MAGTYVNPADSEPAVQAIIDETTELVTDRFQQAMDYADGIYNDVAGFLGTLQSAGLGSFSPAFISPLFPAPISPNFNIGDAPVKPEVELYVDPFPTPLSLTPYSEDAPVSPEVELYLPEFPVYPVLRSLALLTGIQASLTNSLASGGTGLNAAVETEVWSREEERSKIARDEAKEKIAATWGQRGFAIPDGVLVSQFTQVDVEYMNKRLDLSRDIAIKQYELAFQHTNFIIQQVLGLETLVLNATAQANDVSIKGYMADIDGYKARVQVALGKLDSQIKAYEVNTNVYKVKADIISQFNDVSIKGYMADVDGYKSKVQAAIGKLDAQIKAYEGEGNVYRAKAEAQAAIASVDVKALESEINMVIAQSQLFLKQVELAMKNYEVSGQLKVAAAEAGGRIAAALASGIFSGVSVQAHIGGTGQVSKSYQGQETLGETHPFKAAIP